MKKAIIYWSGTGNTEAMAQAIFEGAKEAGQDIDLFNVADIGADKASQYDVLALGCPSMGVETLEEEEFEPFFEDLEAKLSGKKLALFGSYGWGDGEWMRTWLERCQEAGASMINEGLIVNEAPEDEDLEDCKNLGEML